MRNTRLLLLGLLLLPVLPPALADPGEDAELRRWFARHTANARFMPPEDTRAISPEAFRRGVEDGTLQIIGPLAAVQDMRRRHRKKVEDRALAQRIFPADLLRRHTDEPVGHPRFEREPDGNWLYRAGEANPRTGEGPLDVVIQGNLTNYGDLLEAYLSYMSRDNQRGVYGRLYDRMDEGFRRRNGLPRPEDTADMTFEQLEALNGLIGDQWSSFALPGVGKPPGYPVNAEAEEGAGFGGDAANLTTPTGMWTSSFWPLKWCVTSVKSQGRRGSCVAFAVTAAVEAMVASKFNRWTNLSEQMLYNRAKWAWEGSWYGDGLPLDEILGDMTFQQYRYSWESTWDYNASPIRVDFGTSYLYSCLSNPGVPYAGEMCSETNHQATAVCAEVYGQTYCAAENAALTIPPDAKFQIAGFLSIYDPTGTGMNVAKAFLALKVPVILGVTVPVNGMDRDMVAATNGIVEIDPTDLNSSGSHAMCLVGFIPNSALPAGTPPSVGTGYFICKNSWGSNYGDGGFLYLSDAWISVWAHGMYVIDDVLEVP